MPYTSTWVDQMVRETIQEHNESIFKNNLFFSPGEVLNLVKKLPTRSAPGLDGISNTALEHSNKKFCAYLCGIFNLCTRLHYFPKQWKTATIIMLAKPGKDHLHPSTHRPISLLDTMSYEKLFLNRLKTYILSEIRAEQFGFRPHHSTTTQLLNVLDKITGKFNIRHKTAATFLDIEKAFDRVWHDGLIYKLLAMNINP